MAVFEMSQCVCVCVCVHVCDEIVNIYIHMYTSYVVNVEKNTDTYMEKICTDVQEKNHLSLSLL